jgi:hypothetical protein
MHLHEGQVDMVNIAGLNVMGTAESRLCKAEGSYIKDQLEYWPGGICDESHQSP